MNNEYNNLNNKQDNPQIVGFDPITRQPIFDNGLGSRVETKEESKVEKKVLSKGKFILHIFLSFCLWNFIMLIILNFLDTVIYELFKNNVVIYLTISNILWIGSSALGIFATYWFNKFNTALEYQLRSIKNINLIMFFILIIFVNGDYIEALFNNYPILEGVFTVVHMVVIWFVNEKLFDKYWGSDHFWKKTIIILIVSIIAIFTSVILYKMNIDKNSVMTCIRINNDKVVIMFNVDGIEKVSINDKEMSDIELLEYKVNFTSDLVWNNIAYDEYSELELIIEHMKDVKKYEEEHIKFKSKCDY